MFSQSVPVGEASIRSTKSWSYPYHEEEAGAIDLAQKSRDFTFTTKRACRMTLQVMGPFWAQLGGVRCH